MKTKNRVGLVILKASGSNEMVSENANAKDFPAQKYFGEIKI